MREPCRVSGQRDAPEIDDGETGAEGPGDGKGALGEGDGRLAFVAGRGAEPRSLRPAGSARSASGSVSDGTASPRRSAAPTSGAVATISRSQSAPRWIPAAPASAQSRVIRSPPSARGGRSSVAKKAMRRRRIAL